MPKNKDDLYNLIKDEAMTGGAFQLLGGGRTPINIDARKLFFHPVLGKLAAMRMARLVPPDTLYIGGMATGGIAPASRVLDHLIERPLTRGFYVRTEPQQHGLYAGLDKGDPLRLVDAYPPPSGQPVCLVEDVITTGTSVLAAADVVERLGAKVTQVVALIDREAGAAEALAARGIKLRSVYRISQF